MKKAKITRIIAFLVMILMMFTVRCYATSCSEIEESAKAFKDEGESQLVDQGLTTVTTDITGSVAPIIQMLTTVGILIIGICMAILGVQWVMARPSPEEQAKLKNKLIALAISAAVLFGSFTIWRIIVTILDSLDG